MEMKSKENEAEQNSPGSKHAGQNKSPRRRTDKPMMQDKGRRKEGRTKTEKGTGID
jgi:hypothetical protein